MEYALTGEFFSASDGQRFGLVNRVTPEGGALDGAVELAERITANAPLSIAASKEVIVRSADWTAENMWEKQQEILQPIFGSADAREGASAFAEKRTPVWRGE
jgi:enoyl-CoA hydratase